MKATVPIALCLSLALLGCSTAPSLPEATEDGLVRVKDAKAGAVYLRPGAQLGGYTKVVLLEPQIAFRSGWQADTGVNNPTRRVSDTDMQKMIEGGKKLLTEEFTKELTKGGYALVKEAGQDVLAVKAAIVELDVYAPDPNNMAGAWTRTYTNGSGEATLVIELFDSVTRQLLVRAFDHKSNADDGYSGRISRTQSSNINDARYAFSSWAEMLVKGLDRAKTAK